MAHITVQFELTEEQKQKLELFNAQMSMFYDQAREDDFSEKVEQDLGMIIAQIIFLSDGAARAICAPLPPKTAWKVKEVLRDARP